MLLTRRSVLCSFLFVLIIHLADSCTRGQTASYSPTIDSDYVASMAKKRYSLGTTSVSWREAIIMCKQSGMELATVLSEKEEQDLERLLGTNDLDDVSYWIAGTRSVACGNIFVWITTGKPVLYTKFHKGQPDKPSNNQHCLLIYKKNGMYDWWDYGCEELLPFVCQSCGAS